jgi:hypothetical protein
MYINPFWAGVAATILAEFVALIVAAVVMHAKKK